MSLSVENQMYGGSYVKCSSCSVMRRPKDLKDGACIETKRCAEWKASLAKATPADVTAAALKLLEHVKPTSDELLAELHLVKS